MISCVLSVYRLASSIETFELQQIPRNATNPSIEAKNSNANLPACIPRIGNY